VEREAKLTVRQEEEKTADVDMERVEVKAVPVAEFGDYVVDGHSNSNEVFTIYFNVCGSACGSTCKHKYLNTFPFGLLQSLDSGDEHPKKIGTSQKNVKLNRFNNITVCECST
jgi:hypothetical protein